MSYRLFEDSTGIEWQVWDVVPRFEERRAAAEADRRVEIRVIPFADRRRTARRLANTRRTVLRGSYSQGWLCFESGREKRRLSPIPRDWNTCDDATLERYLREGARVVSPGRLMAFDNEAPPKYPEAYAEAG
jgi:hypothetical protein